MARFEAEVSGMAGSAGASGGFSAPPASSVLPCPLEPLLKLAALHRGAAQTSWHAHVALVEIKLCSSTCFLESYPRAKGTIGEHHLRVTSSSAQRATRLFVRSSGCPLFSNSKAIVEAQAFEVASALCNHRCGLPVVPPLFLTIPVRRSLTGLQHLRSA